MQHLRDAAMAFKARVVSPRQQRAGWTRELGDDETALGRARKMVGFAQTEAKCGDRAPRLPTLVRETRAEQLPKFCARLVARRLALRSEDLAGEMRQAEAWLLKLAKPINMAYAWTNNFGNAMYCYADIYAMHALCSPQSASRPVLGPINGTRWRVDRRSHRLRSPSDVAHGVIPQPLSRACLFAVHCRDQRFGHGACWGSYGYKPVIPQLRREFSEQVVKVLPRGAQSRPCREEGAKEPDEQSHQTREAVGVVYMRCGDYLSRRNGHVLLRFDWFDSFAEEVFGNGRVERVAIVSNRKTHSEGMQKARKVCNYLVKGLRTRLQALLGPDGPRVYVTEERSVVEDLYCATQARVLVVASWGTSFGHWASLLSAGCAVVIPRLGGLGKADMGSKHLEPLAWRPGLHYVRAHRAQWIHTVDRNDSVWMSPHRAWEALSGPPVRARVNRSGADVVQVARVA